MKFKQIMKYQIVSKGKALLMYYGISILVISGLTALAALMSGSGDVSMNNMEVNTIVFMFVLGLNALKKDLHFFLANGLSRKSLYLSTIVTGFLISIAAVAIDFVVQFAIGSMINNHAFTDYLFQFAFPGHPKFVAIVYVTAIYLLAYFFGTLISNVYYALNGLGKIVFSVAVPSFLIFVLPYLNYAYFEGEVFNIIGKAIIAALGIYPNNQPWIGIATFLLSGFVFAGGSYLMVRRATLKDA